MPPMTAFSPGNYHYLSGGFQYSAAVMADAGYVIERVQFSRPVALDRAFDRIRQHLERAGRPLTALCACELRSPKPMDEREFTAFNREYVQILSAWEIYRDDANPVARCNLIPARDAPEAPGIHAFSYTVAATEPTHVLDFQTSGAAECPDRPGYRDNIVRIGETSPEALHEKLRYALGDLESRFESMGLTWRDVQKMNLYTVHDLLHVMNDELSERRALPIGINWHCVRPPVVDIEIEIDAGRVSRQILLAD
ncbi:2-amino-5-chloromuconate deaminase CnbZ [Paraburkholderia ferrariae]|uniref:2-amino-5-chloromuconate deaminase CnbZ n=1 Tax=Paraburkholderia ferrariae TaxID=386056 RepID=UPI00047F4746|nr:RidA family protein [Paraburkholderia ferrariae]